MADAGEAGTFDLDRHGALAAIAAIWGLAGDDPASWRLDRFGRSLGAAIENLTGVVFAPSRGLVSGPPAEIRVYPVDDPHCTPLLVCLGGSEEPMVCTGVEEAESLLDDRDDPSPERVVALLEALLGIAGSLQDRAERSGWGGERAARAEQHRFAFADSLVAASGQRARVAH